MAIRISWTLSFETCHFFYLGEAGVIPLVFQILWMEIFINTGTGWKIEKNAPECKAARQNKRKKSDKERRSIEKAIGGTERCNHTVV